MVRAGRTHVVGSVGHWVASFGAVVRAWPALLVRVKTAGVTAAVQLFAEVYPALCQSTHASVLRNCSEDPCVDRPKAHMSLPVKEGEGNSLSPALLAPALLRSCAPLRPAPGAILLRKKPQVCRPCCATSQPANCQGEAAAPPWPLLGASPALVLPCVGWPVL